MNNASLELGGTNWAEKDGNILGYSVGDTSGKYSPQEFTFARGSNLSATRIDRAGLIVKGRENVILQSNQFDTTWTLDSGMTLTSGQSGYDGSSDAWLLSKSAASYREMKQSISLSGVNTFSLYAKASTLSNVVFRFISTSGNHYARFNLSTGAVISTTGDVFDSNIEDIGSGWYRCSATTNVTATQVYVYPDLESATTAGNILIQDAQLEQGLAASPYIETTTTSAQAGVLENTPRLNYTTGVANPYLLLEPSRTNLFEQSEYFGSSYWTKTAAGTGLSPVVTNNYSISPDGNLNASRVVFDINSGTSSSDYTQLQSPSFVMAANYSNSVWLKSNTGTNYNFSFLKANGNVTAITVTSSWQRFENSVLSNVTTTPFRLRLRGSESTSSYADISIYGAQLEEGSYPTSYIPTYSVSATRAQDVCNKLDASGEIGQTEGTMFLDISALSDDATNRRVTLSDGTATNRMYISYKNYTNQIRAEVISAGVSVFDSTYSSTDITQFSKIALAYKLNDFAFYVDGTQVSTDTSGAVPTSLTAFKFEDGSGGSSFFGNVNQAALYKERLTNAELATLTTI